MAFSGLKHSSCMCSSGHGGAGAGPLDTRQHSVRWVSFLCTKQAPGISHMLVNLTWYKNLKKTYRQQARSFSALLCKVSPKEQQKRGTLQLSTLNAF